jgi:transposase
MMFDDVEAEKGLKRKRDLCALEKRRRKGMTLLTKGYSQAEVARTLGVSRTSVMRWERLLTQMSGVAWKRRKLGRPPKINESHLRKISSAVHQLDQAHGSSADFNMLPRVAQVLERKFHVRMNPLHLWRVLRDMGWSYTGRRARENQ